MIVALPATTGGRLPVNEPRHTTRTLTMIRPSHPCLGVLSLLAVMAGALAAQAANQAVSPPESPNFVIIFVDDMGYGDIGPFGSTDNRTPNLDRMAREGMRFTSFYAAPVCSISRAQILTGCYGQRVSVPGVFGPTSANALNPNEQTVAEILKPQGYATMCIGKWHLGDQPPFLPTRQGFDRYFGIPYSNDMQRMSAETGEKVVPLLRDEKVVELVNGEGQRTVTRRYTEEAVSFLRANKDRPFFLYLPHTAVHVPIFPGPEFAGKSANGAYGDWVEEVDWSVGRVLDTLRELKLDRRTLVVFTSDNGPWLIKGKDAGVATPLRGGKGSTWEGGVRVPTVVWWPGRVPEGTACDAVAGTIDLLPTFASLAGAAPPAVKIDGCDLSPLLFGESKESPREAHFYYLGYKLHAVRSGPWKLALCPQAQSMGMKTMPDASGLAPRLYNLDQDIGEIDNVAAEHSEVVERLKGLAVRMAAELGDGRPGPEVRPAGKVEKPVMLYSTIQTPAKKRTNKRAAKKSAP
jgi:arylsulfatase A